MSGLLDLGHPGMSGRRTARRKKTKLGGRRFWDFYDLGEVTTIVPMRRGLYGIPRIASWLHRSGRRGDRGGVPLGALPPVGFKTDVGDPFGSQRSPRQRRPGGSLLPYERGPGGWDTTVKTRRRGPTLTFFGHSPDNRRTCPPGLCLGATVAIVEHGVPLMWSKWVHRQWAH